MSVSKELQAEGKTSERRHFKDGGVGGEGGYLQGIGYRTLEALVEIK